MYRQPAPPPQKAGPPDELVYVGNDRDRRNRSSVVAVQLFTLPPLAGAVAATVISPTAGFVALALSIAGVVFWVRRPDDARIVLRVKNGELLVHPSGSTEPARFSLDELLNVSLDSKIIQRVQEGSSAIPAMRFIDSRVGPEQTTARVILVGRGRPFVPLGEAYLAHVEATEWLGKIRVFLRKHGWVPADERDEEEASASQRAAT
jgi:hypothetical protein